MIRKRGAPLWILALTGTVVAAVAAWVAKEVDDDWMLLKLCMEGYPRPLAWGCEKLLYHRHPTPEEVKHLNMVGGAGWTVLEAKNEQQARRLLRHFLAAGVDINAADQEINAIKKTPSRVTSLHVALVGPDIMAVKLLLELGASTEVRDAKGRTALEFARELQAKHPDQQYELAVHLLENAVRPGSDTKKLN